VWILQVADTDMFLLVPYFSQTQAAATSTSTTPTTTAAALSTSTQVTYVNGVPSTLTSVVDATGAQGGALNGADTTSSTGFFDNSGAVGGTFAAVGIVAVLILAGLAWLFYRRRKAQRMDADVAMAASAAAATTRTPFDDDDPEMMEDIGGYGAGGLAAGSAAASNYYPASQNEYEPSHFSAGTAPGYAGAGAYGQAAAAGAAGAAAGMGGAAGYNDYYANNSQNHNYYDHPSSQPGDYYGGAVGSQSQGHENAFSQGHYGQEDYSNNGYGYGMDGQQYYQQQPSQQGWSHPSGLDGEGMPFSAGVAGAAVGTDAAAKRRSGVGQNEDQLLGPNVFADNNSSPEHEVSPPVSHEVDSDNRLDRDGFLRRNSNGSAHSLRDDQDYTRKVLALAN
jgi:hypothetical protein